MNSLFAIHQSPHSGIRAQVAAGLAFAILWFYGSVVTGQIIPAIPEPGLVMYGSVVNTNASGGGGLAAGIVNWNINGSNSTSAVSTTIIAVNGQYFYIARVPFETRHIGSDNFAPTPNTLEFTAGGATYTRSATVNGSNAVIAFTSSGNLASFPFGAVNRGTVERVDLQVNLNIETFQQWALRYFGTTNVNPNADADGDGVKNYQEFLAGTDPLNKNSLFILTGIRPDSQGGIDVSWQSVANKTYSLLRSTDLNGPFEVVQDGIAATAPTNSFYDAAASGFGPYFYRVKLGPALAPRIQTSFKLLGIAPDVRGGIDLTWESTANNTYSIYRSTNLSQGFINIQSWIPATPGTNTFRDTTATALGPYFYRVKVD
jgi:hypothetical protein